MPHLMEGVFDVCHRALSCRFKVRLLQDCNDHRQL